MNRAEAPEPFDPVEETFVSLVTSYHEALAAGDTPALVDETAVPPELVPRLRGARACLDLLEQARREQQSLPSPEEPESRPSAESARRWLEHSHRVGRFQIERELGRGGYGVVFLAFDERLKRHVALKVPRPEVLVTPELSRRFLREARAAGALAHPNLVAVHEVGHAGPFCYIASAYCRGPNLARWLQHRAELVPARDAAAMIAALADGVDEAHTHGILHRDIKPSNILLEPADKLPGSALRSSEVEGRLTPKLTDFGLAKLQTTDGDVTRSGVLVGTTDYMAPEQACGRNEAIGPATDVYGLGAVLYELLSGKRPFQGENDTDTLRRIVYDEVTSPRKLRPDLPADLAAICLKCLEKDPRRRYASAALLSADLRRFLAGEPTLARPATRAQKLVKWSRRRPALAGLLAVSLASAMAMVTLAASYVTHLRASRDQATVLRTAAERSAAEAKRSASEAEHSAAVAHEQERLANLNLYALRMHQAYQALEQGGLRDVEQFLAFYEDGSPLADWRGFEWYYLKRRMHGERLSLDHGGEVYGVAFSPDGRVLASGCADGVIRFWHPESGKELDRIVGHKSCVNQMLYSPDGHMLATSSCDHTIKLWDAESHKLLATLDGHPAPVTCLALTRDGKYLAAGGNDPFARVWDLDTGEIVASFDTRLETIDALCWHDDDRELVIAAAASWGSHAIVWNWRDGTARELNASAHGLALNPRLPELALAGNDLRIHVAHGPTTSEVLVGHADRVTAVAYSPDGQLLVSGSADTTIRVWSRPDGKCQQVLTGHVGGDVGRVQALAFAPDGDLLASASFDGTVKLWRLSDGLPRVEAPCFIPTGSSPDRVVALSSDFRYLSLPTAPDRVGIFAIRDGQQRHETAAGPDPIRELEFLAVDPPVLCGVPHVGGELSQWNAASGDFEQLFAVPSGSTVALVGDGRHLLTRRDKSVVIANRQKGQEWFSFNFDPGFPGIRCSPDGQSLAVYAHDSVIWIVDLARQRAYRSPPETHSAIAAIANDAKLVATTPGGFSSILFDPATGHEVFTLRHSAHVREVAFSPDGRTLATGTDDGLVYLWNTATGQELTRLTTDGETILTLQFSADGRQLAAVIFAPHEDLGIGPQGTARLYVWSGTDEL